MHIPDFIYSSGQYKIHFSSWLPEDKGCVIDDVVYVPESMAYKLIFLNNNVSDQNIKFAINHALQKVYRFIDNYKA